MARADGGFAAGAVGPAAGGAADAAGLDAGGVVFFAGIFSAGFGSAAASFCTGGEDGVLAALLGAFGCGTTICGCCVCDGVLDGGDCVVPDGVEAAGRVMK